jgi:hypothetical protein
MVDIDKIDRLSLEKLKKLPPKERLKKLKEIKRIQEEKLREIEEKKKDLEESDRLIKELEKAESLEDKTDANKSKKDMLTKVTEEDILAEAVEKESKRWNLSLSEEDPIIIQGRNYHQFSDFQKQYISDLAKHPFDELYSRFQKVNEQFSQGEVSYDQIQAIETLQFALYKKEKDIDSGDYSTTENIRNQIDSTKQMLEKLLSNYRRSE